MTHDSSDTLTLPHLVKWVEMVTRAEAEEAMRGMPVSGGQLFALVLLHERGEATSAELARMMRVTPQAMTTLLGPLRERGYIERRVDSDHARRLLLNLTPAGAAVIAEARSLAPVIEKNLLADFTSDEKRTLKHLLGRIARRFA